MMSISDQLKAQLTWEVFPDRDDIANRERLAKKLDDLQHYIAAEMIQQVELDWRDVYSLLK
jgi:hypothetical protein